MQAARPGLSAGFRFRPAVCAAVTAARMLDVSGFSSPVRSRIFLAPRGAATLSISDTTDEVVGNCSRTCFEAREVDLSTMVSFVGSTGGTAHSTQSDFVE